MEERKEERKRVRREKACWSKRMILFMCKLLLSIWVRWKHDP